MDLLQLKYFRELAYSQHMTELAENLHISQPSLSMTIAKLEDELGIKLFDRVNRKIILNDYGRIFLNHVDVIFNELSYALEEINELKNMENKKIILATTGTTFLTNIIIDFLESNSEITIKQSLVAYEKITELLEKGVIDFAITHPLLNNKNIESKVLIEDDILVVVPKNHPLAHKKAVRLEELKNEHFINLTEHYDFRKLTDSMFERSGFKPNIIIEGEFTLIERMLKSGLGISIIPRTLLNLYPNFPAKTLKILDQNEKWSIGFSWLKNKYMNENSKKFRDFVLNYYK
ncbi:LysR family transcriptional regulator [Tepiditoga spiralis]|uniref:LysR family transcriptional regulator n=1 Tax=Tepiditoga spiralis TaxID=2108365 RepID=A0A7G1G4K1_9BACT|nr:LysR family transcriptional regulator [Tepiditoga spiralis]BBE31440.1 LysR family transcriptional regulator [Tepiditoga spiralis]